MISFCLSASTYAHIAKGQSSERDQRGAGKTCRVDEAGKANFDPATVRIAVAIGLVWQAFFVWPRNSCHQSAGEEVPQG